MNDFVKNNCPVKFPSEFNLKQTINLKISSHKDDDNTEISGSFQTSAAIGKLLNAPEKIKSTNGQISYIKNLETVWDTEPKVFVESNKSFLGKQLDCSGSVFDEEKENHKNYSVGEFDAHQLIYKNLSEEDCNYRLSAVIRHQGVVASAGHYICDVNSTVDNTKKSAWKRYNDAIVNYIDEVIIIYCSTIYYILMLIF